MRGVTARILVVDDEPLVCELVRDLFEEELAADVEYALTGPEGEELIKARRFDLVLIDVGLPGVSGIELTKLAANENLPALLISGHPGVCADLMRFGFPLLTKPFKIETLFAEAIAIMEDAGENLRRVKASIAEMYARNEALKATC